ncbi:MAG: PilT/PilU family type 4a pilus ATPase [Pseudomonadota bacterium]
MDNYLDRRKYTRVPAKLRVVYCSEENQSKQKSETLLKNLSEGGIFLYVSKPIPLSTVLKMTIKIPWHKEFLEAKGKIVWIEEIKENKLYGLGINFTEISEEDVDFIKKYVQTVDLDKILQTAISKNASDVHLISGQYPYMRVFGELVPIQTKKFEATEIEEIITGFLTKDQRAKFEKDLELDISYSNDTGRFRVNVHKEKGSLGAAFRFITSKVKTIKELGLPLVLEELALKPNGIVLVTGPTGSGKSTTLAAMIDLINKERKCLITSLEDPIEYLHSSNKSIIKQREIGLDSHNFQNALKHTLRQDVDVILIGEIRDLESMAIALTAAETGHLVLTSLHTTDAVSSINRIIDIFPSDHQAQVSIQLSDVLRGIVSQVLLPTKEGTSRIAATEVLVVTPAIAHQIRQKSYDQIRNSMITGGKHRMHTLDHSLINLIKKGLITRKTALVYAKDQTLFKKEASFKQ